MTALLLCATLGVATASCGDEGPKSPIAPYTLLKVGTASLPFVMYEEQGYKLEVIAGTLELTEPDKYAMTLTTNETVDANKYTYTDTEGGKWELAAGGAIRIIRAGGDTLSAVWNRTQLIVTRDSTTFTFEMSGR